MNAFDDVFELVDAAQDARAAPAQPGELVGLELLDGHDCVLLTDRQSDADAAREAGTIQALTLPIGSVPSMFAHKSGAEVNATILARFEKVFLAIRNRAALEEIARRLGRHKCWRVALPDNDGLADLLHAGGAEAVRSAIDAAVPWPIEGINHPTPETMLDFRHRPPPPVLSTGCMATNNILKIPGEGKLIVVTGIPNHGKSAWMTHIMGHLASKHDRKWCVFSPEFGEWQNLAAAVLSIKCNRPFRGRGDIEGMTDDDIRRASAWAEAHFSFLSCDAEAEAPTLDWFLDRARACILRDGTTDILLDPWNEIEHNHGDQTETIYVGQVLRRLRGFAARHGVNMWLVAHPTKLRPEKPGSPVPVPTPYDISGGANWANKSDLIIIVHRPEDVTQIHIAKSRFGRWARRGAMAELDFDHLTGRFRSASVENAYHDDSPPGDGE
jgi:twinkle protein